MKEGVHIRDHSSWPGYRERSAQLDDGYIRWIQDASVAYVTDIQSGRKTRGRALLQWLAAETGLELQAIGVVESAQEFWDRMEDEGVIHAQSDEDFMVFFGLVPNRAAPNM